MKRPAVFWFHASWLTLWMMAIACSGCGGGSSTENDTTSQEELLEFLEQNPQFQDSQSLDARQQDSSSTSRGPSNGTSRGPRNGGVDQVPAERELSLEN